VDPSWLRIGAGDEPSGSWHLHVTCKHMAGTIS
jgi:hypothetical protein